MKRIYETLLAAVCMIIPAASAQTATITIDELTVTNVTFAIENPYDTEPPLVTNTSASRGTILNDNGRPRAPGTNVTVTDGDGNDSGVANVTINLPAIGGSSVRPMGRITGTDIRTVTATQTGGINQTHQLVMMDAPWHHSLFIFSSVL